MHPYEMSATLKHRSKEQSIRLNYGSLYAVVESLGKRGLIEVADVRREGNRPERTVYQITSTGRALMVEWLSELLSTPAQDFPQFEAALSLMLTLPPDAVLGLLRQRCERLQSHRDDVGRMVQGAAATGMPRIFLIEHDYELAMLDAELSFVAGLIDQLGEGTYDGIDLWRRTVELNAIEGPHPPVLEVLREEFPGRFAWLEKVGEPMGAATEEGGPTTEHP